MVKRIAVLGLVVFVFRAFAAQALDFDAMAASVFTGPVIEIGSDVVDGLRVRAENGDTGAQISLGFAYVIGGGVPRDRIAALTWFLRSVEGGDAGAMTDIGHAYLKGLGMDADPVEARKWFGMAAERGDPGGMSYLGQMMERGQGGPADLDGAVRVYRLGAERGSEFAKLYLEDAEAMLALRREPFFPSLPPFNADDIDTLFLIGTYYSDGEVVKRDLGEAAKWFLRAAKKGHAKAQERLGWIYLYGIGVKSDPMLSHSWYMRAAKGGDGDACVTVGVNYRDGDSVEKDVAEARNWFLKASELGNGHGDRWLGALAEADAEGGLESLEEAARRYRLAIERGVEAGEHLKRVEAVLAKRDDPLFPLFVAAKFGDAEASYRLGSRYRNGDGVEKDEARALELFLVAAQKGHSDAMLTAGYFYDMGMGVVADKPVATAWYKMSAKLGNATAMGNLGISYRTGDGVDVDYAEARRWFEAGAELGHLGSMAGLGIMAENGQGGAVDLDAAERWYKLAADGGHEDAAERLQALEEKRRASPSAPSDEETGTRARNLLQRLLRGEAQR